jgi:predicted PhzF superfamily epimerase YddE/YHI9
LTADRKDGWIELDFPAEPESQAPAPSGLPKALGVAPTYVGKNRFDYLVEVDSEETVRCMQPDLALLAEIQARGVIVTSRAVSEGYDFVSRFFAPRAGQKIQSALPTAASARSGALASARASSSPSKRRRVVGLCGFA